MSASIPEIATTVLASVGGAGIAVAGLAAWLGRVWSDRIAQMHKLTDAIDLDLRERRIAVYAPLWQSTSLLPKWPRAEHVTYEQLLSLSHQLRQWYFDQGGLYLSRTTHDEGYGPLQDELARVVTDGASGTVSADDYESVRRRCSTLRTMLATDIRSRRDSPI